MVGVRALRSDTTGSCSACMHVATGRWCATREVSPGVAEGGRPALLSQLNGRASMSTRILGPTGSKRRRRFLFVPVLAVVAVSLFLIASASARSARQPEQVRVGQRSHARARKHDRQHDRATPTGSPCGLRAAHAAYVHLADAAASNSDDSFTPGQKQDTTCPTVEGHKNPPKDDFTDVASFTEVRRRNGDDVPVRRDDQVRGEREREREHRAEAGHERLLPGQHDAPRADSGRQADRDRLPGRRHRPCSSTC